MPFNKTTQVSLMIHRIDNTLLIDEFDIHSHLLKMEKVIFSIQLIKIKNNNKLFNCENFSKSGTG